MDYLAYSAKHMRLLHLYTRLLSGEVLNKSEEAIRYNINERSFQRDIDDLRTFFDEELAQGGDRREIIYDRRQNGYRLETENISTLTNSEILAVTKILLESRAFCREELDPILDKLLLCCVPSENYSLVKNLIGNERFHYIPPQHNTPFVSKLWEIGRAIEAHSVLNIEYRRASEEAAVKRTVEPVGLIFSEFYFYMIAFLEGRPKEYPAIYRVDRILSFTVTDKHFDLPYKDRFEEGEFRKKVQFMYSGKLQRVEFDFHGDSVEAVLDRLPTARIIRESNGIYTIRAEAYGKGIDMWIRSQGDWITNVKKL